MLISLAVAAWLGCPPVVTRGAPGEPTTGPVVTNAEQPAVETGSGPGASAARQTSPQVDQLARLEAARRRQSDLDARREQDLLGLRAASAAVWAEVLRTNGPAYQALLQQSAQSPRHTAPCTLCDGRGSLPFCVICGNSGKCVRCNGSGQAFGEPCPTCRGKGKCFHCFGTGKMTCLFCDDGLVYFSGNAPPAALPLPNDKVTQPLLRPLVAAAQSSIPLSPSASASAEQSEPAEPPPPAVEPPQTSGQNLGLALALFLAAIFAIRKLAPGIAEYLNTRFDPWPSLATAGDHSLSIQPGGESFTDFVSRFRISSQPAVTRTAAHGRAASSELNGELAEASEPETPSLEVFLSVAPRHVRAMLKWLQEINRATNESNRQDMLGQLGAALRRLKLLADLPGSRPAWQMSFALEWLVQQLAEQASRVTPSTLRTLASGLDLLKELCQPGLREDLCTHPPLRVLAVDDDAISRHAMSFALKKGVNEPDLAEDGPAALALAAKQPYDVIFMDVQMPGMDGFEVCSRIHDLMPNRTVPVVFVTVHSDFNARAKSSLCGGNDLIGKPFLTSEITVKALTLAVGNRLTADKTGNSTAGASREQPWAPATEGSYDAFFDYASAQVEAVRDLVQQASEAAEGEARQAMLVDLFRRISSLRPPPDCAELQPALQVMAALENLLKKLLEHPRNTSASTLQTLAAAIDLLGEVCVPGLKPDLASNPPVRLLVVDDDPLERQAIACALQLVFERPDLAKDGKAALDLANEKRYDVIFMDVEMPGMDGLTACARIQETAANRQTPVVFVTAHTDAETRRASFDCGGTDFLSKPFLCSELTLKTLTLTLRSRLQLLRSAEDLVPPRTEEEACLTEAH
jgi:CheY-like chemotaxis protein